MEDKLFVIMLLVVFMTIFFSSLMLAFYRKTMYLKIFSISYVLHILSALLLTLQNYNNIFFSSVISNILLMAGNLRHIPIIFISALDDTANKVTAFSFGGVDYITKPFQEEEVFARMENHLKLRRAQKELEKYNHDLEELVQEKVKEITDSQMATLVAMSNLAEFRDETTGHHIERTSIFCQMIATQLGVNSPYMECITPKFINEIYFAAPLHDIGKVGVPDNILLKPGKFLPEEFEIRKILL